MNKSQYPIVKEVTAESMAGDSPLEKEINALITKAFIGSKELPADECLLEARRVIEIRQTRLRDKVIEYLTYQFGDGRKFDGKPSPYNHGVIDAAKQTAEDIDNILLQKRFMNASSIIRIS